MQFIKKAAIDVKNIFAHPKIKTFLRTWRDRSGKRSGKWRRTWRKRNWCPTK